MSQRVYSASKRNRVVHTIKLVLYRPEIKRSNGETGAITVSPNSWMLQNSEDICR